MEKLLRSNLHGNENVLEFHTDVILDTFWDMVASDMTMEVFESKKENIDLNSE
jgi:hypothetical protein